MSPLEFFSAARADGSASHYPPSLTGLRGSHEGSFEVAHSVAWQGKNWGIPKDQTDDTYDLVIVGGGISGLTAAYQFQKQYGGKASVLILENHDDFGGHAKRNEFDVDGQKLIGYGGSQSIETPSRYSAAAATILKELAIETDRFYGYFDDDFYKQYDLNEGIYFDPATYEKGSLTENPFSRWGDPDESKADIINKFPLSTEAKAALIKLTEEKSDYFPDLNQEEKKTKLRSMSYIGYMQTVLGLPKEATTVLRDIPKSFMGTGFDALSALDAIRLSMPGMSAYKPLLKTKNKESGTTKRKEPYIFHFPDGNAGIARLLVRKLIPEAAPGTTMEDIVSAVFDYSELDKPSSPTRIRLMSTAVDVRHAPGDKSVDVTYVRGGQTYRARGKHAIMACYNNILPHICPEMPEAQREALSYAKKTPLVYTNIVLRNWRSFVDAGYDRVFIPNTDMHHHYSLDFPVSMGGYQFSKSPDDPMVVHAVCVPTAPDQGFNAREQNELGRHHLYSLRYDDYEKSILSQMDGMFGRHGLDVERDIAAITVNRWPHGYAYWYNDFSDPLDWGTNKGPHVTGRAQMGRISIANSDASARAYVDGAMDAAVRAVDEQMRF
ncbi:MAG: FAD-dependent oxidoreductase [Kordiimonadaceae bacterium]|nr:FAD-dependent oxidoreductase [Kordiimonadaceae bacterium]